MKLSECKVGVLVCENPEFTKVGEPRIGHIVGLKRTDIGVWPIVRFADPPLGYVPVLVDFVLPTHWDETTNYNHLDLFTAY